MRSMSALGKEEFANRWHTAQQRFATTALPTTFTAIPSGTDRPWTLDPIPLLISPAEWA